jgi:hypothetical protein
LVGNSESVEAGNLSGRSNGRGFYPILLVAAVGAVRCDGFKGHGSFGSGAVYECLGWVAFLAQDGQIDEARTALDRLKELQPEISVAWIEQNAPWTAGPMPKYVEGMRKAGLQ